MVPSIVYADQNVEGCENNPAKSSTGKVAEHISSGFSFSTILYFLEIV